MSVAGLILSAGESKRMGSPKALLEFRGETFLDRLIGTFSQFCSPVVVVLGCEADRIRAGLRRKLQAVFAENPNYRFGQLSSMQCGLRAIPPDTEGVLFTLVDHPNVRRATIAALLSLRALASPPTVARPPGSSFVFQRRTGGEFLDLPVIPRLKS